jgi:hypothetical protein
MPMIAITTSSSTKVKADFFLIVSSLRPSSTTELVLCSDKISGLAEKRGQGPKAGTARIVLRTFSQPAI